MLKNDWTEKIENLERENIDLKETVRNLRWEGNEYEKKLNKIDELALLIENAIKGIREKI